MSRSANSFVSAAARAATLLLLLILVQPPPAASGQPGALEPYSLVSQWPDRATGSSGVLQNPVALDAGLDGRVYVSDAGVGGIHVMLPSGQLLEPFGATGDSEGRLGAPGKLSVEQGSERVFVLDVGSERVVVYDLDGAYVASWDEVPGVAIAAASDGLVYIADSERNQIRVFDGQGVELSQFGGPGTGDGEFSLLSDIGVSGDGKVLAVGDSNELRVQLFDVEGGRASLRHTYHLNHPRYNVKYRSSSPPYQQCRAGVVNALGGDVVWVGDGSGACRLTPEGHTYTIAASAGSGTICKQTVLIPRVRPETNQYYAVADYDPNVGPCYSTRRGKDTVLPTTPAIVQFDDPDLKRVKQIALSAASAKDDAGLVGPVRLGVPQPGVVFVQDSTSYSRFFAADGRPVAKSAMRTRFASGVKCRRWIEIADGTDVEGEIVGYYRHEHLTKDGKEPDCPGT